MDTHATIDRGHGRVETRRYFTLTAVDKIPQAADWEKLNMVGMVQSERQVNGKTTLDHRFYIGSIGGDAQRFAWAVRNHWGIENRLHWCLDIAFREDESRVRDRQAANNLAVLRHIALNSLKKDGSLSFGVGKGSGPIGYPGTQAWAYRCGGNLARWSLPADSVWTKRGCRERPWGQAGDNSQVFQSVRARCATNCPRLAPTHPPFAHTAPRSPRCGPGTPAAQQQLAF